MFTSLDSFVRQLAVIGACLWGANLSHAQSVDFRQASKVIAPATVAVMLDSSVAGQPDVQKMLKELSGHAGMNWQAPLAKTRAGFAVSRELVVAGGIPRDQVKVQVKSANGQMQTGEVVVRDHVTGLAAIAVDDIKVDGVKISDETMEAGLPVAISWLAGGDLAAIESAMIASNLDAVDERTGFSVRLDADFDPEQTGAAVVDVDGAVLGILLAMSGKVTCVPATVLDRLIQAAESEQPSDLDRGRMGVQFAGQDAKVKSVLGDSPASRSGLQIGDVIVKVGDHACQKRKDVIAAVAMYRGGDKVKIGIKRDGKTLRHTVELDMVVVDETRANDVMPMFRLRNGELVPLQGKALQGRHGSRLLPQVQKIPGVKTVRGVHVERSQIEKSLRALEGEKLHLKTLFEDLQRKFGELEAQTAKEKLQSMQDSQIRQMENVTRRLNEMKSQFNQLEEMTKRFEASNPGVQE